MFYLCIWTIVCNKVFVNINNNFIADKKNYVLLLQVLPHTYSLVGA